MRPNDSRSTARFLWTLSTVALLCAGCSSMGSLEPPDVTLAGVQLTEVTMFETTIETRLRIGNPNNESLTFDGASFKLELEDRKVGRGMTPERFTIPRLSTEVVDVTFHVNNAAAMLRLKQILEQQTVTYSVWATLYLERSTGSKKLKAQKQGEIDFSDIGLTSPSDP